jgi:hypothetical protein
MKMWQFWVIVGLIIKIMSDVEPNIVQGHFLGAASGMVVGYGIYLRYAEWHSDKSK